jgi:hypothetical protein
MCIWRPASLTSAEGKATQKKGEQTFSRKRFSVSSADVFARTVCIVVLRLFAVGGL